MRLFPARPRKTEEHRRRRFGLLLFFGSLLALFFLVRAVPADWEIGPFRIDATGNAADPTASLYFADDPHAPFWLLDSAFHPSARLLRRSSEQPTAGSARAQRCIDVATRGAFWVRGPDGDAVAELERVPHADSVGRRNTDAHAHIRANALAYANPHIYAYADADAHADGDANTDTDAYPDTHTHTHTHTH